MPKCRTIFLTLINTALLLIGYSANAGDPARGQEHYFICQTCHGVNAEGNQLLGSPRLVGLKEWYLTRQMQNFRSGLRGADPRDSYGQQMAAMAQILPDEQAVQDVVAYIATLDAPPSPRTETSGDPDSDRAEALFHDCIQCHGTKAQGLDSGTPNDPRAPRLSGQDDWYLIRQMQNYQSGIRGTHEEDKEGLVMRVVAKTRRWSDQDIKDVVAYIKTYK